MSRPRPAERGAVELPGRGRGPVGGDESLPSELVEIARSLDALGAAERGACPPDLTHRVHLASAPRLGFTPRADPASRWGAWSNRGGALAAAIAIVGSGVVVWLALMTGPGDRPGASPIVAGNEADPMEDWFAIEEVLAEPLDSRIELLEAETEILAEEIHSDPFDDFWIEQEGAL